MQRAKRQGVKMLQASQLPPPLPGLHLCLPGLLLPRSGPSHPSPDWGNVLTKCYWVMASSKRLCKEKQYQDYPSFNLRSDWTIPVQNTLQHLKQISQHQRDFDRISVHLTKSIKLCWPLKAKIKSTSVSKEPSIRSLVLQDSNLYPSPPLAM